jgi:uncharacterized protein YcaQ
VSERVLTVRELNRALLARQLLLERSHLPLTRALERVAGLQAQDPRAPYFGLWTRLDGFSPADLTRAVERRRVVKTTLMRGTLHLVTARDYVRFAPALQQMVQELWRSYLRSRGEVADVESLARRASAFADRPRSSTELRDFLGGEDEWWRVRRHVLLVHAPTGATWAFGRGPSFVAAEHWLAGPNPSARDGTIHLLRRYLAAFGPATLQDAATWSGLTLATLRPVAESLAPRLRHFRDERGRPLLDIRGGPLPPADTPAPPRLLPPFDNAILSHTDRTRILRDEHRRTVIRAGIVDPVFLVDGFVAGRWRFENGRIALEPFAPLTPAVQRRLAQEGERLASFADLG